MATVVPAFIEDTSSDTSATFTAPSGISGMQGLIAIGTGVSTAITISASSSGATFTKLVEQAANNTRATLFKVTGLSPGATVNLTWPSGNNTVGIAQIYTDEYTLPNTLPSAGVRSSSQTTTTTGAYTPSAGQRILVVGVERTSSATTVSSVVSSGGESVTTERFGEGATIETSVLIARFDAADASSHTATITYSNASANGFAVLVPLTAVAGGGGSGGGGEPSLTASYLVTNDVNGTSSLVSPSFTPANGEVVVVKASTNDSDTVIGTPTGGSQTYALRGSVTSGSFCHTTLHTAVISGSPGSMTVTLPFSGDTGRRSMMVERWSNAQLDATPVAVTQTGSGAPSTTLTTEANNSVISWVNADWNGVTPTSRAYRSSAVEVGIHDQSAQSSNEYVGYYAYQETTTAGAATLGMTAPTGQAWSLIGVEVMGVPTAGSAPTVRTSTAQGAVSGTTSTTVANPGVQLGDYIVAVHAGDADNDIAAMTGPAGFGSLLAVAPDTPADNSPHIKVYGKTATSGDVSAINFVFTDGVTAPDTDSDAGVILLVITAGTFNVANPVSLPIATFTEQPRTATALQTAPSVTGSANQLCLAVFAADINNTPSSAPFQDYPASGPAGMTRAQSMRGGANMVLAGLYYQALNAAAATGTRTVTPTNAGTQNGWAAGQILINPATATTDTTRFLLAA